MICWSTLDEGIEALQHLTPQCCLKAATQLILKLQQHQQPWGQQQHWQLQQCPHAYVHRQPATWQSCLAVHMWAGSCYSTPHNACSMEHTFRPGKLAYVPAGLLRFTAPALPADLNEGFEDSYTRKDDTEASPVDTIVQAASAAGVDWSKVSVCTYRNNLNKILQTPLADSDWSIDCCYWSGTLFLDINKAGSTEYPNQDKFTFYGENGAPGLAGIHPIGIALVVAHACYICTSAVAPPRCAVCSSSVSLGKLDTILSVAEGPFKTPAQQVVHVSRAASRTAMLAFVQQSMIHARARHHPRHAAAFPAVACWHGAIGVTSGYKFEALCTGDGRRC